MYNVTELRITCHNRTIMYVFLRNNTLQLSSMCKQKKSPSRSTWKTA